MRISRLADFSSTQGLNSSEGISDFPVAYGLVETPMLWKVVFAQVCLASSQNPFRGGEQNRYGVSSNAQLIQFYKLLNISLPIFLIQTNGMKQVYQFLVLLFVFTSCSNDRDHAAPQDPVLVASETDYSKEIFSKRGNREDLVERLYAEKLKSSKELSVLDDAIRDARQYYDSTKTYNEYNEKSTSYYSAANGRLSGIKDSVLRKKLERVVKSSSDKYALLTSQHRTLLSQLDTNGTRIDDLHTVIKVLVTLPDMENYQKKNLPAAEPMQKAVEKQKNVIRRMDSLVVKSGR